jgi:uncharacterized protein YyaL (SSP411 family)
MAYDLDRNQLDRAASPYLLQHAKNPVHWQIWSREVLDAAAALDKPILLSVGYAACHWCHVMAHESFEDSATADVMNALFVNIKVDREERPDIDHIYMSALHALGERGGWPLTMFLTPAGEPFWGGTYFPKVAQYGRSSFVDVLNAIARTYETRRDAIGKNAASIRALLQADVGETSVGLTPALAADIAPKVAALVDRTHGGLQGAPKFFNLPLLELLWRDARTNDRPDHRDLVLHSLVQMCQGGVYDHLGGGFARYSTDEMWLVPHFEKMLYDNAQLLEWLGLAWTATGNPLFRARAQETVGWLLREMTNPDGAFCASLDADSEGVEGKFYVWTFAEIVDVFGAEDGALFGRFYDATSAGNWSDPHGNTRVIVLNRRGAGGEPTVEEGAKLDALRARLLTRRNERVRPGRDDKIMADWNGLTIAALVRAGTALNEPDWLLHAARAYRAVCDVLETGTPQRLAHSWRDDVCVGPALALDLAAMAAAAMALHQARHHPVLAGHPTHDYLADACRWAQALRDHHLDTAQGRLCMAAHDANDVILRLAPSADDAIPNAHPVALDMLVRLTHATGDGQWLAFADDLFAALSGPAVASPLSHAGVLNALDFRLHAAEIVTLGPDRAALYRAALALPFLDCSVEDVADPMGLPPDHPAKAQAARAGAAAAFICRDGACQPPVHEAEALAAAFGA